MTKITISYRRNDSDAMTGRIFDRLVAHYGADAVFRDIDNIPPGLDFRKHIGHALDMTDVLLAIVGPRWKGEMAGGTRINDPTDLVRIEIEAALRKDIPVVPVLVGDAKIPDPNDLPDGLKDLPFRNAVKIDALEDFEDHVRRLIRGLDRMLSVSIEKDERREKSNASTAHTARTESGTAAVLGQNYSQKATTSLIVAVVGLLFFGVVLGPIAMLLGMKARGQMRISGNTTGDRRALAAIIIGAIDIVVGIVIIAVAVSSK